MASSDDNGPAGRHPAIFSVTPWLRLKKAALRATAKVPTMLSKEERRLYLWLAEHWATGAGAIVDLGAFAGGSTSCLAEGTRRAGRRTSVMAFDRFRVSDPIKEKFLYPAGVARFDGNDLLPLAERLLAPWHDLVSLEPGEIETANWTGGPIEILAVDAAKSAAAADRIAEIFFPHLIPGRSVVVQQDFLHWKVPWLPAQMEWLATCFRPLAHCRQDTVVFLCTRIPDPAARARARVRERRDKELKDAIASVRVRLNGWGIDDRLAAQERAVERNPHARRAKDVLIRP